ncbi:MAG: diaminopimelate epimerase [Xanthomonadales bacterium]|jgi:diaminopimelate epimerase|nr:diaminopimelate epimerase [Xanthomonadales bacterium]MDH3926241.1 diaminopimelate epimerase [Xanthomonadales bacterium]MDH3942448.1 diaminopimelate epimerase [Xanthomonadales bacterium]MDH4001727.1 diaminopimelate epimerase [Xanthomonadales bacterium]
MPFEFHKMHGAGNDFVLIDARRAKVTMNPELAARISDRHLGIGCDQILVLSDPQQAENHARYEIWNADGSPALQCGNGARCIGLYLEITDGTGKQPIDVESPSGVVRMRRCDDGEFELEMGVPQFDPAAIPLDLQAVDGLYQLDSPWGLLEFGAVSMGNPHVLVQTRDIDSASIPEVGAFLSTHAAFPAGCNAGFAQLAGENAIHLRVVERGAGETLACGSGACAAVAILRKMRRVGDTVDVFLPGGHLVIKWLGEQEPLTMKGPAMHVFRGIMNE